MRYFWAVHNYFQSCRAQDPPAIPRGRFSPAAASAPAAPGSVSLLIRAAAANQIDLRHKADFDNAKREFAHNLPNDRLFFPGYRLSCSPYRNS